MTPGECSPVPSTSGPLATPRARSASWVRFVTSPWVTTIRLPSMPQRGRSGSWASGSNRGRGQCTSTSPHRQVSERPPARPVPFAAEIPPARASLAQSRNTKRGGRRVAVVIYFNARGIKSCSSVSVTRQCERRSTGVVRCESPAIRFPVPLCIQGPMLSKPGGLCMVGRPRLQVHMHSDYSRGEGPDPQRSTMQNRFMALGAVSALRASSAARATREACCRLTPARRRAAHVP
jgi:hypothetical protein